MNNDIRVRFAPSPTGPLHIGGLRTALYNYLFAKKNNGSFILRIEDTDQNRFIPGAENYIVEALKWIGIEPDESPLREGPYPPYKQSEKKEEYAKYADQLIEAGWAYYAFDTVDELESARRQMLELKKEPFQYNVHTRDAMKNSLTLSEKSTAQLLEKEFPYVIRLKVPRNETVILKDLIRGEVSVNSEEIDDKVILKSDGMPTYHLANVVDDHQMKISHVIRGEEWLPSAPLHVLLYKYLGWEDEIPSFAHLPLLLKPDGKGKLSKRDGIKHGFPVFPLQWSDPNSGENLTGFRESGYLPDAFTNFLALLGWNPGTEQEIFSLDELIQEFSIERIGKGGARFDIEKAKWFNQQYLKDRPLEFLADQLEKDLETEGIHGSSEKNLKIASAMRERITFPSEIWSNAKYFYIPPNEYDEKVIEKKWNSEVGAIFSDYANRLEKLPSLNADEARELLNTVLELHSTGMGKVMQVLRVVLTGEGGGPDLMLVIEILGPKECSERIFRAIEQLG